MNNAAIFAMAGRPRPRVATGHGEGSSSGAGGGKAEEAVTVTVKKSGGWFLPFSIGVVGGIAGTMAMYRLLKDTKD